MESWSGGVPEWACALLVEMSVPLLWASVGQLWNTASKNRRLRNTREAIRKAVDEDSDSGQGGGREGLRQLLDERPSSRLGVFRGEVARAANSSSSTLLSDLLESLRWRPHRPPAVVRLSTREVCWKNFSPKRLGRRVTYQLDRWSLETDSFRVVDPKNPSENFVHVPRLRATEAEGVLEKMDLALLSAERRPVVATDSRRYSGSSPVYTTSNDRLYNALVRGRYASHVEVKEKALLCGTSVTVVGRVAEHDKGGEGEISLLPDGQTMVYITEKNPDEILADLDKRITSSLFAMAGLALASTFFAGVLGVYLYVVGRGLYRALVGGPGGRRTETEEEKRRRRRNELLGLEPTSSSSSEEEEEEDLAEEGVAGEGGGAGVSGVCCICLARKNKYVLVPCGHCCTCKLCAISLFTEAESKGSEPRCPICRVEIDHFMKVYK